MITIDFETEAIDSRPNYPPKPVGVAMCYSNLRPEYWAFGHPSGNNTTREKVAERLRDAWNSGEQLLFHNAKFDLEVAKVHFDLDYPSWSRIHDTMLLLFLFDPHAPNLALKPAAERLLNMPPDEQDTLRQHLYMGGHIRKNQSDWGAAISKGDGGIVGQYAVGDIIRTMKLYDEIMKLEGPAFTMEAYNRERALMPILMENEEVGLRVDLNNLIGAYGHYSTALDRADEWLATRLNAPSLNVEAPEEVAHYLRINGVVNEFRKTATGKDSLAKKNLTADLFTDREVYQVYGYRQRLATCLNTFIRPWIELATQNHGRIFTNWSQVRNSGEFGGFAGARTGRLSCSPNFMNIPTTWEDKNDGYEQPKGFPALPLMRRFILPDEGQVFFSRDWNQQELRILAHYENGALMEAYRANPTLDVHTFVRDRIKSITGLDLERKTVKILNFGLLYGMGLAKLAFSLGVDPEKAREIKTAQRTALPGIAALEGELKRRGRAGIPIRTWGGRFYLPEPPKMDENGNVRSFEYKLLNYLIQGSAADCVKEAIIRYYNASKEGRFLVAVHDEINISAPFGSREDGILRDVMESMEFDVKMLTKGSAGESWGQLIEG